MKKGCFLKAVIILTIVVASATYIYQNKFNDFIFTPGKKIILPIFVKEYKAKLENVKESSQKDSLNLLVRNYIEDSKNITELSDDALRPLDLKINSIVLDSVITSDELNEIKDFLNLRRQNEGSEKN